MTEPAQFLRLADVKRLTGLSRSSIYARIQQGEFPRQIKIGRRTAVWDAQDIADWQSAQRRANAERPVYQPTIRPKNLDHG